MRKLLPMPLLAGMILLGGCQSPDVGRVIVAPQPQKPLIPAAVRTLPLAAAADLEQMLLDFASGITR